MATQKEILIRQFERVFNGPAWHGPSIKETLQKISAVNANNQFKDSHSLIILIGHMTAWRKFVIERLKGNNHYEVSAEMNFPLPNNLATAIQQLEITQQELLEALQSFPEERFKEKAVGREYSFQTMLHGILHHDLYHLGQIALLNR